MSTLDDQHAARQTLSEALQDAWPSRDPDIAQRQLRAVMVSLDRRGYSVVPTNLATHEVVIGPIQHDPGLCRKAPCNCWCGGCTTHAPAT